MPPLELLPALLRSRALLRLGVVRNPLHGDDLHVHLLSGISCGVVPEVTVVQYADPEDDEFVEQCLQCRGVGLHDIFEEEDGLGRGSILGIGDRCAQKAEQRPSEPGDAHFRSDVAADRAVVVLEASNSARHRSMDSRAASRAGTWSYTFDLCTPNKRTHISFDLIRTAPKKRHVT